MVGDISRSDQKEIFRKKMTNDEVKAIISTGEFYRLISTTDQDERSILIGADLTQVRFKQSTNLSGLDLSDTILDLAELYQAEMRGCNLSRASLKRAELFGANLSKVNLTNTDLTQANLTRARLSESTLTDTNFTQANLEEADFDGIGYWSREKITIQGANFQEAILRKANLRGYDARSPRSYLDLSTANLKNADLMGSLYDLHTRFPKGFNPKAAGAYLITAGVSIVNADLSFTNLFKANLSGADLSGTNLTAARINSANLSGANLSGATIVYEKGEWDIKLYANVHLERAILRKAKIIGIKPGNTCMYLNGIDLTEAQIINCAFTYCDMDGARLVGLRLDGLNFFRAKLRGADLSNASLRGCNLGGTDLRGVNLKGTDLSGANLQYANLTGTDLSETKLDGADLTRATLEGARMPT